MHRLRLPHAAWLRFARGSRPAGRASLVSKSVAALSIGAIAFVAGHTMQPGASLAPASHQPAVASRSGGAAAAASDAPSNPIDDSAARAAVADGLAKTIRRLHAGPAVELPPASVSRVLGPAAGAAPGPGGQPGATATRLAVNGIPSVALQAYQDAAVEIDEQLPQCHLQWPLLAAIGQVESGHGLAHGAHLTPQGDALPPILGPRLTGGAGTARILDTDGGRLDGDTQFDRAVGPMQFLPSTWKLVGVDGNGDGRADPNNIYDATLSAATYLCAGGRDLARPDQLRAAVLSYNHSAAYADRVLALADAYATNAPVALALDPGPAGTEAGAEASPDASALASSAPGVSAVATAGATPPAGSTSKPPTATTSTTAPESASATPTPTDSSTACPSPSGSASTVPPTSGPSGSPPSPSPTSSSPSGEPSSASATGSGTSNGSADGSSPAATSTGSGSTGSGSTDSGSTGSTAPSAPSGLGVDPAFCGAELTSLTPELTAMASGEGADAITYTFQVWADDSVEPAVFGSVNAAAGQPARWSVPAGALASGAHYSYRVRAGVGDLSSGWSAWFAFTAIG